MGETWVALMLHIDLENLGELSPVTVTDLACTGKSARGRELEG